MNCRDEDTAAPLVDTVAGDSLGAAAAVGAGRQGVVVVVVVAGMLVVFVVGRLVGAEL